jgi:hypothetical protein
VSLVLALCCLLAGTVLATTVSRPATTRSRERAAARRAALVAADPSQAHSADVVAALRRDGRTDEQVHTLLRRADELGHTPASLWRWLEGRGADAELGPAATTTGPDDRSASLSEPGTTWGRVSLSDNVNREKAVRRRAA